MVRNLLWAIPCAIATHIQLYNNYNIKNKNKIKS